MMKKQILKNILLVSFVFLLIGLCIFLYLTIRTSNQEESLSEVNTAFGTLPSPIIPSDNLPGTITAKVNTTLESTSNKVYRVDTQHPYYPSLTFTINLAKTLDMKKIYEGQNIVTYESNETKVMLDFDKSFHMLTIKMPVEESSVSSNLPSQSKAQILAQNKLENLNLWPFEGDVAVNFSYYKEFVNEYFQTNDMKSASLMNVSFTSFVDSLPKLISDPNSGEITVLIDKSSQIKKIEYRYRPINRDIQATYPLINVSSAITQLQQGYGEFVISHFFLDTEKVTLTDVTIGYRIESDKQEYIQPVYYFEGSDSQNNPLFFLVPAINGRYLIDPAS